MLEPTQGVRVKIKSCPYTQSQKLEQESKAELKTRIGVGFKVGIMVDICKLDIRISKKVRSRVGISKGVEIQLARA